MVGKELTSLNLRQNRSTPSEVMRLFIYLLSESRDKTLHAHSLVPTFKAFQEGLEAQELIELSNILIKRGVN